MSAIHASIPARSPVKAAPGIAHRPSSLSGKFTDLVKELKRSFSRTSPVRTTALNPTAVPIDTTALQGPQMETNSGSTGTRRGLSPRTRDSGFNTAAGGTRTRHLERSKAQNWAPATPASPHTASPQGSELMEHLETYRQAHYDDFAGSSSIRQALQPSADYSRFCRATVVKDMGQLHRAVQEASRLAETARMPHVFKASTSYATFRRGLNEQLGKDAELLGKVDTFVKAMRLKKADFAASKMVLSDLMELVRSDRYEAREVGRLLKGGYTLNDLLAGVRLNLHAKQLSYVTSAEDLRGMPLEVQSRRFGRLMAYQQALPDVKGTAFFRLADAAFKERMSPAELETLNGKGAEATALLEKGLWLSDITAQVQAYRAALPDMPEAAFTPIARQAMACGLPAEHLKPMVEAGVPINARMKPSSALASRFEQALKVESRPLGGGASGSELRLVTLTHADGTEEKLVTKRLVMSPMHVPFGHANAGIPFVFEDIAEKWNTSFQLKHDRSASSVEEAEGQSVLERLIGTALVHGDTTVRWDLGGTSTVDASNTVHAVELRPGSLPNLYGRDLAMRELASLMGQPGLVAGVQTAVIDGVYCEVAAFDPHMSEHVIRPNGDAVLKLATPAQRAALAAMDDQDLQKLATSRGFEAAQRLDDNAGVRFELAARDKAVGFFNRFDSSDPVLRQRYNEHQVKNFLGNEADDHESNSTVAASWDHDGSFGITTSTTHHKMPRLVSASTWAALQQPDWSRFDGLILPKEIDALKARHQAFIDSRPMVVPEGGWDAAEVATAMDIDQLQVHLQTFNDTVATAQTPAERRKAVDQLADAVLDLDTPMARHAGAWAIQQLESTIAGKPGTAYFDQEGWTREIEAAGQQVHA